MAAFGVELGFAPGSNFGKAQAMEDFDDEANGKRGADEGDEHRLSGGLGRWITSGWWSVGASRGNEFLHGD